MEKLLTKYKLIIFFVPLLSVFVFILRFINLTILPIFADEAIYIRWSQIMANEPTLRFLPLSDGKQPFYMWVLMFFVHRFNDPLFIGRLVSVFAGVFSSFGIFVITFILFKNQKVALFSMLFYAVSPFSVFFDRMALVDSTLNMFVIWTFIFGVLMAKTKRTDMAMLTGFALGGASLIKSPALFIAIVLPTVFLFYKIKYKIFTRKYLFEIAYFGFLFVIVFVIALGLYNIQRLGPNFHLLSSRTKDYVFPINHLFENPLDPFVAHIFRSIEWIYIMGPFLIFPIFLVGFFTSLKKYYKEIIFLLTWMLFPLLVQAEFAKVFTARYIFYLITPIYIISALSVLVHKKYQKIIYVFIFLYLIQAAFLSFKIVSNPTSAWLPYSERSGYLEEWTAGWGIKEVADFLVTESNNNPDKKITIGTEGYFGTLPDGLQIYLEGEKNITAIGIGLGINRVHEDLVKAKVAGDKVYLLANSSRLNFDYEFDYYNIEVVKQFEKPKRQRIDTKEYANDGPFETLYLFEIK